MFNINNVSRITTSVALAGALGLFALHERDVRKAEMSLERDWWQRLHIHGSEVEDYESLRTMKQAADATVVGQLQDFRISRHIAGDAAEDRVSYAVANLVITESLGGAERVGSSYPVEFLLGGNPDNVLATIQQQAIALPKSPVIAFLRAKRGSGEKGLYRLVNGAGLWAEGPDGLIAPMADVAQSNPGDVYPVKGDPAVEEFERASRAVDAAVGIGSTNLASQPNAVADPGSGDPRVRYAAELRGVSTLAQLANFVRN
jgi:hypothetical protein